MPAADAGQRCARIFPIHNGHVYDAHAAIMELGQQRPIPIGKLQRIDHDQLPVQIEGRRLHCGHGVNVTHGLVYVVLTIV